MTQMGGASARCGHRDSHVPHILPGRSVQANKNMQTLEVVEVETIEHGAGLALIPVFFPDKPRSEEDV